MPLQETSGSASYDAFGGGVAERVFIEDVFSTWLYTGNGSTQTITNGIDLDGEGGLVWIKARSGATAQSHALFDTQRGVSARIQSDTTSAEYYQAGAYLTSFNSDGFTVAAQASTAGNNYTYASWTFRKAEKFFDVVTWTGNSSNRTISHNLGSVPGCIIVKRTDTTGDWQVYHRSLANTEYMVLNTTAAKATGTTRWNSTTPTSTEFSLGTDATVNASGGTYVAYLFAHDAGGFGLTGADNVISCGSVSIDGTGYFNVNLGYEPQFILWKAATTSQSWAIYDTMRGMDLTSGSGVGVLYPNSSDAEGGTWAGLVPTSTGFYNKSTGTGATASNTYIYIAIRRGQMKTPESGTEVFSPVAYTGTNVDNRLVNTGLLTDMTMARIRTATSTGSFYVADRLRGNESVATALTDASNNDADSFMTPTLGVGNSFSAMNGFGVGNDATRQLNQASTAQLAYAFRRAPGFFDVVCYSGTGVARTVNHNLGVAPEMMIVKRRSASDGWGVYHAALGATKGIDLNDYQPAYTTITVWNNTSPTSTVFTLGTNTSVNGSGDTYVAYLFATLAGVSKVGSYTGTGTTLQINCGFSAGARFVLIKRTDGSGSSSDGWYVWDSARGIVAGNDSYLLLNSTAAEVTSTDYIDPYSAGFEISSTAPAGLNANGGTYIFLAIA